MKKRSLKVLVVDDDAVTRFLMSEFLETLGHHAATASSGEACMELVCDQNHSFDMIFMDLNMPGMNGIETAAAIRAINKPCAKSLPILALTSDTEFALSALDAPMTDVLNKPLDMRGLERALARHARSDSVRH